MWQYISWMMVAGIPAIGLGILWALFLGPAWPAWLLIGTGFTLCLPIWLDCIVQEFTG